MSCGDELDLIGKQLDLAEKADNALGDAADSLAQAQADYNLASTDLADTLDPLSGEVDANDVANAMDAYASAVDALMDAQADFDGAVDASDEEDNFLDQAQDDYCDCKRTDPNP